MKKLKLPKKEKPLSMKFSTLEAMARKKGLPVFAVLDLIVHSMIKHN